MGVIQALNLGSKTIMDRLAEIERRLATIERIIGVHSVGLGVKQNPMSPNLNLAPVAGQAPPAPGSIQESLNKAAAEAAQRRGWVTPELHRFDG